MGIVGHIRPRRALALLALISTALLLVIATAIVFAWPISIRGLLGNPRYQVVERWELRGGGFGMYAVVSPTLSPDDLRQLGERLRDDTASQPAAVVMVFDDIEAARIVRRGARIVGNEAYEQAISHQLAGFVKRPGEEGLYTLLREPRSETHY